MCGLVNSLFIVKKNLRKEGGGGRKRGRERKSDV